jgi:hypothetical protein
MTLSEITALWRGVTGNPDLDVSYANQRTDVVWIRPIDGRDKEALTRYYGYNGLRYDVTSWRDKDGKELYGFQMFIPNIAYYEAQGAPDKGKTTIRRGY